MHGGGLWSTAPVVRHAHARTPRPRRQLDARRSAPPNRWAGDGHLWPGPAAGPRPLRRVCQVARPAPPLGRAPTHACGERKTEPQKKRTSKQHDRGSRFVTLSARSARPAPARRRQPQPYCWPWISAAYARSQRCWRCSVPAGHPRPPPRRATTSEDATTADTKVGCADTTGPTQPPAHATRDGPTG